MRASEEKGWLPASSLLPFPPPGVVNTGDLGHIPGLPLASRVTEVTYLGTGSNVPAGSHEDEGKEPSPVQTRVSPSSSGGCSVTAQAPPSAALAVRWV